MDDVKVTTDLVASVEDPGGEADGVLQLQGGTRTTLARKDPRFPVWLRLLKGSQTSGLPVYVASDAGGAARTILPLAARRIEKVDAAAGDKAAVTIFMSPSPHPVRTGHPEYAALRALLEESVSTKQSVLVAVEPKSLEILSV